MPSDITTKLRPDKPVTLSSDYQLDSKDRRKIDDQIVGVQTHLAESVIRGQQRSYFKLDPSSVSLAKGDVFCVSASSTSDESDAANAVRVVTRGTDVALASAGMVAGIAATSAAPGTLFAGIVDGIVGPGITGLGATAGAVRVNSARCQRVATLSGSDFAVGFVDSAGNLTMSRNAAGAAVGGGASLSNSNPVALAAVAAPGSAIEAARIDHAHQRPANATTSVDGYHSATDKTHHDLIWSAGTISNAPSNDDTGATDLATLNALITQAVANGTDVVLQPGRYLTNDSWLIQEVTQKLVVRGAGCGRLDLGKGTIIEYVGPRAAGRPVIDAIGSNVSFKNLHVVVNLAERAIRQPIGTHQPTGASIDNCIFSSRDVVVATSTTNLTAALASFTLAGVTPTSAYPISTHAGSSTRATSFPDGSKVLLVSRSSPRTQLWCIVNASGYDAGAHTLSVTAQEIYDTSSPSAHNDWDIRQPGSLAVDYTGVSGCKVKRTSWEGFYTSWLGDGSFSCSVDDDCITGQPWGTQFIAGVSAYKPRIEATLEPNGLTSRQHGVSLGTTFKAILRLTTGDPAAYGTVVTLNGGRGTIVDGVLISAGNSDPIIRARGTESLRVIAELQGLAGCKGVDFTGGTKNLNVYVDAPSFPTADLVVGTAQTDYSGVVFTGDGVWRHTENVKASYVTVLNTLQRYIDSAAPLGLGAGSNTDMSVTYALQKLTTTANSQIHGCTLTLEGQEQVLFYRGTHTVTFKHQSGTQPSPSARFVCPLGVDLVLPPPASGGFWAVVLINVAAVGVMVFPTVIPASALVNDSSVSGTSVKAALETLASTIASLVTGVSSVFGRAGAVTATAGDYTSAQVNDSTTNLGGTTTAGALGSLRDKGHIGAQVDNGNSGAAKNIALSAGANQKVTVNQNTTLTLTAPAYPCSGTLLVNMNASGFTVAWAGSGASVRFEGGSPPVPSPSGADRYTWIYDGTTIDVGPFGYAFA